MSRYSFAVPIFVIISTFCVAQPISAPLSSIEHLGKVSFPTSCTPAAQQSLERGLALMHSFQYEMAESSFREASERDSNCAMALWGQAINLFHLLQPINDDELKRGHDLLEEATKILPQTQREHDYIEAASIFYRTDLEKEERRASYSEAMAKLSAQYPEDADAAALYALSVLGSHHRDDLESRKKALSILEPLFAREPEHPGAAHYLIHAADTPELADRALAAARTYARIAPASSHALHMPSHIFTHLGLWQDAINCDKASVAAAAEATAKHSGNEFINQIHAMTYLEYAYLQTGRDAQALQIIGEIKSIPGIPSQAIVSFESYMRAIYVLETHRWEEAAQINPEVVPAPYTRMRIHLARAIAAARAGRRNLAAHQVEELHFALSEEIGIMSLPYPPVLEGDAWLAYAQRKPQEALDKLQTAIKVENNLFSVDSSGLPAYEVLGDLLLAMHRPAQALDAYESSLKEAPKRFNSVYGAARSAELSGKQDKAQAYYAELIKIADPQSDRPELESARKFISKIHKKKTTALQ
jgi:tetratricopeptide (TPR) repeat protein